MSSTHWPKLYHIENNIDDLVSTDDFVEYLANEFPYRCEWARLCKNYNKEVDYFLKSLKKFGFRVGYEEFDFTSTSFMGILDDFQVPFFEITEKSKFCYFAEKHKSFIELAEDVSLEEFSTGSFAENISHLICDDRYQFVFQFDYDIITMDDFMRRGVGKYYLGYIIDLFY